MSRGEVWLADLGPPTGTEIAGQRPVLVFQADAVNVVLNTIVGIPFTTNLRLAKLPTCLLVARGAGGLTSDAIALCHQIRAIDKNRLRHQIGTLAPTVIADIEDRVKATLEM